MGTDQKKNLDDDDYMTDLDDRLSDKQPELRRLLRDTAEGQEILQLVAQARLVIATGKAAT